MTALDVTDPTALEAALDAVPLGHWADVTTAGETHRVVRVTGGWYLPGDLVVATGDLLDGRPDRVELLGDMFGEDPGDVERLAGVLTRDQALDLAGEHLRAEGCAWVAAHATRAPGGWVVAYRDPARPDEPLDGGALVVTDDSRVRDVGSAPPDWWPHALR